MQSKELSKASNGEWSVLHVGLLSCVSSSATHNAMLMSISFTFCCNVLIEGRMYRGELISACKQNNVY